LLQVLPLLAQQAPLTQLDPLAQQMVPDEEVQTSPLAQQAPLTQTSPLGQQKFSQAWLVGQQTPKPMHVSPLAQQVLAPEEAVQT
jgi:hypothetical protein